MVLKLYGAGPSTCTRRIGAVLREKKVDFQLIPVDVRGGAHKKHEYLEKQPFGQIPYLVRACDCAGAPNQYCILNIDPLTLIQDDDGFILYESRAICRYIVTKYANQGTPGLIPTGLQQNALFEQAASVEQNNFDPYASKGVWEMVLKP
jgi:glutathione S-transferase